MDGVIKYYDKKSQLIGEPKPLEIPNDFDTNSSSMVESLKNEVSGYEKPGKTNRINLVIIKNGKPLLSCWFI